MAASCENSIIIPTCFEWSIGLILNLDVSTFIFGGFNDTPIFNWNLVTTDVWEKFDSVMGTYYDDTKKYSEQTAITEPYYV